MILYAATTLEYFLEPFDHDLGRCPLASAILQDGVRFQIVDQRYFYQLEGLVKKARTAHLPTATLATIMARWERLADAYVLATHT